MIIQPNESIEQKLTQADRNMRSNQAKRLMWFLHRNGPSMTPHVASECAIGNISHASGLANDSLVPLGLKIVCSLPEKLIKNRFGDVSQSHIWRLTELR